MNNMILPMMMTKKNKQKIKNRNLTIKKTKNYLKKCNKKQKKPEKNSNKNFKKNQKKFLIYLQTKNFNQ